MEMLDEVDAGTRVLALLDDNKRIIMNFLFRENNQGELYLYVNMFPERERGDFFQKLIDYDSYIDMIYQLTSGSH